MLINSGIAPVGALVAAGARVGIGVDGSASNDSSHLLDEVRHALLLQRVADRPVPATARDMLRLATRGGAAVLGRDDVGMLAPGMAADIVGVRIDTLGFAGGAVHDVVASLVNCRTNWVDFTVVNGETLVERGALTRIDVERLVARHNELAYDLVSGG